MYHRGFAIGKNWINQYGTRTSTVQKNWVEVLGQTVERLFVRTVLVTMHDTLDNE